MMTGATFRGVVVKAAADLIAAVKHVADVAHRTPEGDRQRMTSVGAVFELCEQIEKQKTGKCMLG